MLVDKPSGLEGVACLRVDVAADVAADVTADVTADAIVDLNGAVGMSADEHLNLEGRHQ